MKKNLLLFAVTMACMGFIHGQVNINKPKIPDASLISFHTSLTDHLRAIKPSLTGGVDLNLTTTFGVNLESGYIYDNDRTDRNKHLNGYKIGIEPKFYIYRAEGREETNPFVSFYWGFDHISSDREERFSRLDGAYFEEITFNRKENSYLWLLNVGSTQYTGKQIKTTIVVGVGSRTSYMTNDLPEDVDAVGDRQFFGGGINRRISGIYRRPALRLSIYLSWSKEP